MKKNPKQIAAIIALAMIAILIICFIVSAFSTSEQSNHIFFICFFLIIAVPIISWLFIFCYGRFTGKHTMAELFPKEWQANEPSIPANPSNETYTEQEITAAMEESKKTNSK